MLTMTTQARILLDEHHLPPTIVYVPYQLMQVRPTNYTEMNIVNDTRGYSQS